MGVVLQPELEGVLLALPFGVAGVAGDGEGAAGAEEGEAFFDADESGVGEGGDRFVGAGEIAEVVDDEAGWLGEGKGVDVLVGEEIEGGVGEGAGVDEGLGLDVEADGGAEEREEEGVVAVATGGVDGEVGFCEVRAPEFVG